MTTIISSVISGFFTLIGIIVGVIASSKLTNYRIEQLEKKVDTLSNLDNRLTKLETLYFGGVTK